MTDESTQTQEEAPPARTSIEVRVGERTITVGRFKGYKATRIMQEAAKLGRRYPRIGKDLAAFREEYRETHTLELTRTQAELRFGDEAREISDKAWEQMNGILRLPQTPSLEEQLMAVYPQIIETAQDQLVQLIGLLALGNGDARDAWEEGGDEAVDEAARKLGNDLLFDADAEEVFELVLAGVEVGKAQFGPLGARVRALATQIGIQRTPEPPKAEETPQTDQESTQEQTTEPETEPSPTPPPSSQTSPPSSTDSPRPTDGPHEQRSTRSPGSPSAASPSA